MRGQGGVSFWAGHFPRLLKVQQEVANWLTHRNGLALDIQGKESTHKCIASTIGVDDFFRRYKKDRVLIDFTLVGYNGRLSLLSNDHNTIFLRIGLRKLCHLQCNFLAVLGICKGGAREELKVRALTARATHIP